MGDTEIKTGDKALFQISDRPIWNHVLCGFSYDANHDLGRHSGNIIEVYDFINAEYTMCVECNAVTKILESHKKYRVMVGYTDDEGDWYGFLVSSDELKKLTGVFDD